MPSVEPFKLKSIILIQKFFRSYGIDIRRYHGGANEEASFVFALKHFNISKLIDVGANEGQFGSLMQGYGYQGDIVSFEPLPDAHEKLKLTASKYQNWIVAPRTAVGERNGTATLNIATNSASSSIRAMCDLHRKAAPGVDMIGQVETPIHTLDSILETIGFDATDAFLKIDTQGYEKQVLDGASETISKIKGIQLEWSLDQVYVDQEDWFYFLEFTRSRGFKLWNLAPELYVKTTGQLVQVNATFFRV